MINMTNVEYIDYFEKIIANEPENILSLYFVQKLMSDVRFRSFQPMISAELQKKILKMVLPKLKNQFKINRLVDFNPIGVADEEIEILNKESVTDVGTFVKTLDDGKVCKEIENPRINVMDFVLNKEFLRKASELLKKHQWEMICRHYIEGMTHREIAAEMGVSHQYVTKGIKKGLHRIRCTYT